MLRRFHVVFGYPRALARDRSLWRWWPVPPQNWQGKKRPVSLPSWSVSGKNLCPLQGPQTRGSRTSRMASSMNMYSCAFDPAGPIGVAPICSGNADIKLLTTLGTTRKTRERLSSFCPAILTRPNRLAPFETLASLAATS